VRAARPWHWVKNVFVLLPLPFAVAAGGEFQIGMFVLALVGFCLVNSAVYVFNDTLDAEADRLHPQKRLRPVPSGDLAPVLAIPWSFVLLAAGLLVVGWVGRPNALLVTCLYAGISLAYCLGGKNVPLLDIFMISAGFVIRVLLGCFLLGVPPSNWLLLCSSALALFLGSAKRHADLAAGLTPRHRLSLAGYDERFLSQLLGITATVSILSYCLYSFHSPVFIKDRELASVPFVAYAVLHYLRVALLEGTGASPVVMFYQSRTLQVCMLAWFAAVTWSVGMW
jgi:4-hydroxybenzoate polyprenyltransferase